MGLITFVNDCQVASVSDDDASAVFYVSGNYNNYYKEGRLDSMTKEKPLPKIEASLKIEEQKELEEIIRNLPYILKKLEDEVTNKKILS